MTAGAPSPALLLPSHVTELFQTLVKALRAFQMYLPNNPIHQRAAQNVRAATTPIWNAVDELVLNVGETELRWEEEVVYSQINKAESLAWMLYKDGMRVLTIRKGAEEHELVEFLELLNRVRFLPAEAGDDLMTLLWERDFHLINYHFIDFFGEGDHIEGSLEVVGGGAEATAVTPEERHGQVKEEAPPRPKGIVDIEDFDSTLYFLEEAEINYVAKQMEEEYARDARLSALHGLFDLLELQPEGPVRLEIIGILEMLFPNLLNKGEFRTVAAVLRETRLIGSRVKDLTEEQRQRLRDFEVRLSQPSIVTQLVQSLDEGAAVPADEDVTEVLRELRPSALGSLIDALPRLTSSAVRGLLEATVDRLATAHPTETMRLLREPPGDSLPAVVALCGRLTLQQAVPGLGELVSHGDAAVRLATVQALEKIGTPGALTHIDRAIEDEDRAVRLAAVRVVGARGYKGALRRIEAVVMGKAVKELDLTEKMAFFEAYGAIAGAPALRTLSAILLPRGLLKLKQSSDTRACAAIAIGKIRTPEARDVLNQAADDKDLVVRNAVNRALRESAA
ncbi:MAG TPA: HEAT repeat domain-containing protein [Gemmatimonadales bacterium]|nr:HEAT repeat domain-containing protein [Gemmatimonadales bacterium]